MKPFIQWKKQAEDAWKSISGQASHNSPSPQGGIPQGVNLGKGELPGKQRKSDIEGIQDFRHPSGISVDLKTKFSNAPAFENNGEMLGNQRFPAPTPLAINPFNWKKERENILDKSLLTSNPYVNGKDIQDINKRNFIKKGILGLMFGAGIIALSKMAKARYIFPDATTLVTAPATPGLTRVGGNTTEATTTSTSAVDLLTISSLTIASSTHVRVLLVMRKTSGAAAPANTGLKLNTVAVAGINQWTNGNNAARDGYAKIDFLAGGVANYTNAGFFQVSDSLGNGTSGIWFGTAAIPAATITDIVSRASVGSASITQAHDEMHAYTYAVS